MTVRRMTRATWYKHRFSVVGLPAVFLLAALALFADSVVAAALPQRASPERLPGGERHDRR